MQISDVIADMLTRIRNANSAKHETVDIPASSMKKSIADILKEEGYIAQLSDHRGRQAGCHPYHAQIRTRQTEGHSGDFAEYPSPGLRIYSNCEDSRRS